LLDPDEAEAELDGPATVASGLDLHHALLVRNLSGGDLVIVTNGQVTAVIVDPATGEEVGSSAGAQTLPGVYFRVIPGAVERIPLLIGTACIRPDLGYTVPPGPWGIVVPLVLQWEARQREARRTPILPLTVTG
jgi:hypothetical protein